MTPHTTPPPRRRSTDYQRTEAERVAQIIRHQALGHAVRYGASFLDRERILDVAAEFAAWIETGER